MVKRVALVVVVGLSVAHADPEMRTPHRWRWISAETIGLFGIGQAWYWRHGASTNSGDWELPFTWDTIGKKLTGEAVRYDGDSVVTNGLKHPLFGLASYEIARENGFGVVGSFLFASLTSGLWETFGEWREYASINDLMFTSPAGVPIGEAVHQMLHHLRETHVEALVGFGSHREGMVAASFETASVRAEYPGVGLAVVVPFDQQGTRGLLIDATAALATAPHVALVSTFDYRDKSERAGEMWDVHAMVGIGPRGAYNAQLGDATVELAVSGQAQTGMERPTAYDAWHELHPGDVVRASIQTNRHGYYHAVGVTSSASAALNYRGITCGGFAALATYTALRGHDRFADRMTADPDLSDSETAVGAWFGLAIGRGIVRLDYVRRSVSGSADAQRAEYAQSDVLISGGLRL